MHKMLFLCRRRDGLDHAGYVAHLLERHAPLALEHLVDMRGYELNVVDACGTGAEELDSINALYFDTAAAFADQRFSSPDGARLLEADHPRFLGGAHGYATREIVAREPDASAAKHICAVQRADALTHDAFIEAWLDRAPTVAAASAGLVTDVVDSNLYGTGGDWDCVIEWHGGPGIDALLQHLEPIAARTAAYAVTAHRLKTPDI